MKTKKLTEKQVMDKEISKARVLYSEGKYAEACEKYKRLYKTYNEEKYCYLKYEYTRSLRKVGAMEKSEKYCYELLATPVKYLAALELGRIEFSKGELDYAKEILGSLLRTTQKENAIEELMFIAIKERKYQEAFNYLNQINVSQFDKKEYKNLSLYLKYMLGKMLDEEKEKYSSQSYFLSQLVNYNEEIALSHIKLHLDETNEKREHSVFNNNISIDAMYEEVLENLTEENRVRTTSVDKYDIVYPYSIGVINEKDTNVLRVITIVNTDKILSMYPIENCKRNEKHKSKKRVR